MKFNELPDAYQNIIMAIGDSLSTDIWRLARITNVLIDVYTLEGKTRNWVYSAVAEGVGKPLGTVRDYAEVAQYFSQDIQDKYKELNFDHFRRARRLSKKYSIEPEIILKWAISQTDNAGHPATVDSLIVNFAKIERPLQERLMIMLESLLQELIDAGGELEAIKTVKCMLSDIIEGIHDPKLNKYWLTKDVEMEVE
jgi:hypothetical protein